MIEVILIFLWILNLVITVIQTSLHKKKVSYLNKFCVVNDAETLYHYVLIVLWATLILSRLERRFFQLGSLI